MEELNKLVDLLEQKKQYFIYFQNESSMAVNMTLTEIDQYENALEKRGQLILKIIRIDEEIRQIAEDMENGTEVLAAMKNACSYGSLKPPLQKLFEMGQEIFRIINMIQETDRQAAANLNRLMAEVQDKIKKNNKNTKLAGYYSHLDYGVKKGFLYNEKR